LLLAVLAEIFAVTAWFTLVALIPLVARLLLLLVALRRLVAARWLDAAQSTAQFFEFPLIHYFLAFGDFDEFEHFVELINHVLQRNGDFRGVFHSLRDGRTFGGAKISRLHPRLRRLAFRLGRTLLPFLTLVLTLWATRLLLAVRLTTLTLFWSNRRFRFGRGFGLRFTFGRVSFGVMRGEISGLLRMWFAKTARGVGFRFAVFFGAMVFFRCFGCAGIFVGFGRGVFIRCGTRTTSAATTTTAAAAAICGAQRRGGRA